MSLIGEILVHLQEKKMEEKFWAVWRSDGGSAPSRKHETKSLAITEAARLSQQTNTKYFVLEVIGYVVPQEIPVNYFDLP